MYRIVDKKPRAVSIHINLIPRVESDGFIWVCVFCIDMKEAIITILSVLFKNELGDWPHQYFRFEGYIVFGAPMVAGLIELGVVGGIIFGLPLICLMLLQRFIPI